MIKVDNLYKISNYDDVINDGCPSFSGIITGECKGDLWVDNIDTPQIAIAYSYAVGGFAFLGTIKSDNEYVKINNFINNDFFKYLKQKGIKDFEYSVESDCLKTHIQKMFKDKLSESEKEYSFRKVERINTNYSLPENFKMQEIDFDFWKKIADGCFKNDAFLTKRLLESWGNFDNFKNKSIAFCITNSDSIVSVIVGTARFKNVISIDIETDDKFKHKGFGYYLTIEFVNECINKGLIAQWDCVESNHISIKLANKAEFMLFKESTVYWFEI